MRQITPSLQESAKQQDQASLKWLIGRIDYLRKTKTIPGAMNSSNYMNPRLFIIGEMFLYHYDPKLKYVLPYYDKFPLVIPLGLYDNGFLGLNLHYLPPDVRLAFMKKLMSLANVPANDTRMRLEISYEVLVASKNLNEYMPCLKRYLISHVESRILKIQPHEWLLACYLPIANWKKNRDRPGSRARIVYRDSMRKIKKKKV